MKLVQSLACWIALSLTTSVYAFEMKEFHIASGTGKGKWNTAAEQVELKVGDVLRIFNDDTIEHRLHTNGAPCAHGSPIKPGDFWDCTAKNPFDPAVSGALYDHNVGPAAAFWVRSVQ